MVDELTPEQIDSIHEAFIIVDADKDKAIDFIQFCMAIRYLGQNPTKQELVDLWELADPTNLGRIEFETFLRSIAEMIVIEPETVDQIREAFRAFDPQENGVIPGDKLYKALMTGEERLTDEEMKWFIKFADIHKDGKIDYEEFVNLMMVPPPPKGKKNKKEQKEEDKNKDKI